MPLRWVLSVRSDRSGLESCSLRRWDRLAPESSTPAQSGQVLWMMPPSSLSVQSARSVLAPSTSRRSGLSDLA